MAIVFVEKEKRQKYLIYIFLGLILITTIVVLRGRRPPEEVSEELILKPVRKIEIDFEVLKNPFLKELQPIEKIEPLTEGIGRQNPFVPY